MRLEICIILILLVVGLLCGCTHIEELKLYEEEKEGKMHVSTWVGYGWSTKSIEKDAVDEAISMMEEGLQGKEPEYIILFLTVDYNVTMVVNEVLKHFPNAQLYGGTSCRAVLTKDGYISSENGAMAIMGICSENITFGVGGAEIGEISAKEAGKLAITEAISNAGLNGKPDLILITGSPGYEEEVLLGIEEIVGKDVPIFGGSAADNTIEGKWKQIANGKVYSNGVSVTAIFTDMKIGYAFESGYLVMENEGVITNSSGRRIYEIDGRPAADVYNEWTSGKVFGEYANLTSGEIIILKDATFYPLAKKIQANNKTHYISIHPRSVNLSDRSISVFANVNNGDMIQQMHGTWEILLNRGQTTPAEALKKGNIEKGEGVFGIYTFCAGTMLAIPDKEREKLPLMVYQTTGIPFIGTFTFGEQGFIEGIGNVHENLANSIVVIG